MICMTYNSREKVKVKEEMRMLGGGRDDSKWRLLTAMAFEAVAVGFHSAQVQ